MRVYQALHPSLLLRKDYRGCARATSGRPCSPCSLPLKGRGPEQFRIHSAARQNSIPVRVVRFRCVSVSGGRVAVVGAMGVLRRFGLRRSMRRSFLVP
jgi:hypothetical protein